jgi:hypothetical protein
MCGGFFCRVLGLKGYGPMTKEERERLLGPRPPRTSFLAS